MGSHGTKYFGKLRYTIIEQKKNRKFPTTTKNISSKQRKDSFLHLQTFLKGHGLSNTRCSFSLWYKIYLRPFPLFKQKITGKTESHGFFVVAGPPKKTSNNQPVVSSLRDHLACVGLPNPLYTKLGCSFGSHLAGFRHPKVVFLHRRKINLENHGGDISGNIRRQFYVQ